MQYQVYSKNLEITESLQEYIDMRMSNMDKISMNVLSCRIDLSRDEHHRKGDVYRVEINYAVPKNLLRVVEINYDVRAAIDLATEKLLLRAKKFHAKQRTRERRYGRFLKLFKG